jgi:hypothetical protein
MIAKHIKKAVETRIYPLIHENYAFRMLNASDEKDAI